MDNIIKAGNSTLRFTKASEPLLVLFEHMDGNPILKGNRGKRHVWDHLPVYGQPEHDGNQLYHCKRYNWFIDMEIFYWDWYIEPSSYKAGYCSGDWSALLALVVRKFYLLLVHLCLVNLLLSIAL